MREDIYEQEENQKKLEYYSYVRNVMESKEFSYWIGNPSVQIISGTIYLKPGPDLQTNAKLDNYEIYLKQYRHALFDQLSERKISRTLCLAGIPNNKTPIQVCQKLKAYLDWIVEMKVVKANCFKYYSILLLLKDEEKSEQFYRQILGDQYNGLEIERLLLRQMSQISYSRTETSRSQNEQLFQIRKKSYIGQDSLDRISAQKIFISHKQNQGQIMNSLNINSPKKKNSQANTSKNNQNNSTCTICLQETDDTIISILCCHSFHFKCLQQWKQSTCPLCRYHQHPPLIKFCQKCNQCEGLWVCLICGVRLCCGLNHNIVANDSHIYEHYLQTHHRLSMDVQTKFIFDASQLAFLHQIFYKQVLKNDSTLGIEPQQNNKNGKKTKLTQKISQYEQNISQQMQKQRAYFQQNINKEMKIRKDSVKDKKKQLAQLQAQLYDLDKQIQETQIKNNEYETNITKFQKEIKIINDVQKFWKAKIQGKKQQSKQKQVQEKNIISKLDFMIAEKKQQLKDAKKNSEISEKLKQNLGNQTVEKTAIVELGNKNQKKKKK